MDLRLVQLIGFSEEFVPLTTKDGIQQIAAYAAGIGPSMHLLVDPDSDADDLQISELVALAHAAGLKVHPYTFRKEVNQIPAYAKDFDDLLDIFFNRVGVDGVFTDFPDRAVNFLETHP
jgi:glycerophosphoryl diester phosphodiesterase